MEQAADKEAGFVPVGQADAGAFQYSVTGLRFPAVGSVIFHGLIAGGLLLLGHPAIAAAFFVGACAADGFQQAVLKRWLLRPPKDPETVGLRKLALMCFVRTCIYVTPTAYLAVTGGRGELAYFGVQACALVALAIGGGSFSRLIFWASVMPATLGAVVLAAMLPLMDGLAMGLALLTVLGMLAVISSVTQKAITTWHDAYVSLGAARDEALAERVAADAAREEAREANRAKSAFLATMSHEIRTPMNGVLGMAQLLQRDERDPLQKQRLEVLIDSGEYLLSILNDILDVSKIDAGRLEIIRAPEDLRLFLDRLVGFWGARADEKGVTLALTAADTLPDFVEMDALRLRQVLFNLVGNALKFTEQGRVDVVADASPAGPGAVLVHLAVRDTGPGIAPEHLPMLFDRFSQVEDGEVRRFGGTGLGLAIAKQLVELMGGAIWAESTVGRGSAFHVRLPLTLAEEGASKPAAEPQAEPAQSLDGLKVLAVDDNPVNLLVLDQLLTSLGCEVAKVASGAEALAALATAPFDLVLMDIQMPEMSGSEAVRRLRASDGPNRDAPVVALTADVTSGGRKRYLAQGFDEHCAKPIQLGELLGAIDRALDARGRETQAA